MTVTEGSSLKIKDPSKAVVSCVENCDDSCNIGFVPTDSGDYNTSSNFTDKLNPGSSCKVQTQNQVYQKLFQKFRHR